MYFSKEETFEINLSKEEIIFIMTCFFQIIK
jgi:hypothetical protein